MDARTGEVWREGLPVHLPPQPFKVLFLLASHAGDVVTREEIRRELWGHDTFVDFDGGLNFCINQIRKALRDNAESPRFIHTLPRRGYRFIASVESVAVAPAVVSASTDASTSGGEHAEAVASAASIRPDEQDDDEGTPRARSGHLYEVVRGAADEGRRWRSGGMGGFVRLATSPATVEEPGHRLPRPRPCVTGAGTRSGRCPRSAHVSRVAAGERAGSRLRHPRRPCPRRSRTERGVAVGGARPGPDRRHRGRDGRAPWPGRARLRARSRSGAAPSRPGASAPPARSSTAPPGTAARAGPMSRAPGETVPRALDLPERTLVLKVLELGRARGPAPARHRRRPRPGAGHGRRAARDRRRDLDRGREPGRHAHRGHPQRARRPRGAAAGARDPPLGLEAQLAPPLARGRPRRLPRPPRAGRRPRRGRDRRRGRAAHGPLPRLGQPRRPGLEPGRTRGLVHGGEGRLGLHAQRRRLSPAPSASSAAAPGGSCCTTSAPMASCSSSAPRAVPRCADASGPTPPSATSAGSTSRWSPTSPPTAAPSCSARAEKAAVAGYGVFVRPTDGAPPVRLGEGRAMTISPDGAWVLTMPLFGVPRIVALPTGAGEPRTLATGLTRHAWAGWFPDSRRVVFTAAIAGQPLRAYVQDLDGGPVRALTGEVGLSTFLVTRDGRRLLARTPGPAGRLAVLPRRRRHSGGGPPRFAGPSALPSRPTARPCSSRPGRAPGRSSWSAWTSPAARAHGGRRSRPRTRPASGR